MSLCVALTSEDARVDAHVSLTGTTVQGNLRLAVTLPEGEDLNEWLAVNSRLR